MTIIVGSGVFLVGAFVGFCVYKKGHNDGVLSTEVHLHYLEGKVSSLRSSLTLSKQNEQKAKEKLEKLKQKKTKKRLTK